MTTKERNAALEETNSHGLPVYRLDYKHTPRAVRRPSRYRVLSTSEGCELLQTGKDRFCTVYGLEVIRGQTYEQAATQHGCNIMHSLACEGKIS